MANVISGGVSSLPGRSRVPPAGTMCDNHPDVPAVRRVLGEPDSMGCEELDWCQACVDAAAQYKNSPQYELDNTGTCEWCRDSSLRLFNRRDWEEGSSGRVYRVCMPCITKHREEEFDQLLEEPNYED